MEKLLKREQRLKFSPFTCNYGNINLVNYKESTLSLFFFPFALKHPALSQCELDGVQLHKRSLAWLTLKCCLSVDEQLIDPRNEVGLPGKHKGASDENTVLTLTGFVTIGNADV